MSAWWLRPWKTCRQLRAENEGQRETIGQYAIVTGQRDETISGLRGDVSRLEDQVRRFLEPSVPEGLMGSPPEFVLVGIDRGGLGKRLMASRDLGPTALSLTEMDDPPPRWKLESLLPGMLMIDKPGYGEALERLTEIWPGWKHDARESAQ